jgi:phosphoribosylformimino-5-aminoimidazole carboxamide ribotide isomerase
MNATSPHWDIYPAIDLRQGRVVRLQRGDPNAETHYYDDPLEAARRWQRAGARWLHVVNLDGALDEPGNANLTALKRILGALDDVRDETSAPGPRIQFGGGIRGESALRLALRLGVSRVVIGTAAVEDAPFVEEAIRTYGPDRVAVGIDARQGSVRTHGWQRTSSVTSTEFALQWADRGLRWCIFTDIARDGMGTGLNVEATADLAAQSGLRVIASGGVDSLNDVARARAAGCSGVIIGRALYDERVSLKEALEIGREPHAG